MDIDVLKSLVTVAETGSFSQAATSLCISQSAVSKRIKLLEERLHVPLLDRSGQLLQLTPAGKIVMKNARAIIKICCSCETELKKMSLRQSKQKISLCCTPSLGLHRLSGFFSSFVASQSTAIDFNCEFSMPEEALAGIENGRFDLALIDHCDEIELKNYTYHHLPDDEVVFISSPVMGISKPDVMIEQLLKKRLFLKNQNGCARRFIDKSLQALDLSINAFANVFYFDDLSFILDEVMDGKGISFMSREFLERDLLGRQLVTHRVAGFNHFRPRTIIFSQEHLSPLLESFVNELFTELGICGPYRALTHRPS